MFEFIMRSKNELRARSVEQISRRSLGLVLATLAVLNSCDPAADPAADPANGATNGAAHSQRRAAVPGAVNDSAAAGGSTVSTDAGGASTGGSSVLNATSAAGTAGAATAASTAGFTEVPIDSSLTLRAAAEQAGVWIGAAIGTYHFDDTQYATIAAAEFNYITPENELKWSVTEPAPDAFEFAASDALVAFAESNQMRVKGHCLVWYSQLPTWVKELSTAEDVRLAMTRHINQVVGRYRGRIAAWDVVNEAIDDGNDNALRDNVFLQRLGEGYIGEAFRLARAADPTALLFYNDYSTEGLGGKSDAAYALMKRLVDSGVPIDGVGLQMHIGTGWPSAADITANIRRLSELGLLVNISELDVSVCDVTGDKRAKLEAQRQRYREVVAACLSVPRCHAVTVWGLTDKYSWLNHFLPCSDSTQSPWGLPWDDDYARKPAWSGIAEALVGKTAAASN